MSTATPNAHDWHCEEHDTYGWRGEACRKCPEAPSEITTLREQVEKLKEAIQLSEDGALMDQFLKAEREVEKLRKERDSLVAAIDNEMVVTHMGVFNPGDDPKEALNRICCYAQDLGKFFAEDAYKAQLAALAEQNEKMREALQELYKLLPVGVGIEALSFPDLATPVLNRIRAEGVRKASTLVSLVRNDWASAGDNLSVQAAEYLISALDVRADELEKTNG